MQERDLTGRLKLSHHGEERFGRLLTGVKVGGVMISLTDIGIAIVTFSIALLLAHLVRRVVRDQSLVHPNLLPGERANQGT